MTESLNTLLPVVGGLAIVVILLNAVRPYLRRKKQEKTDQIKNIDKLEEEEVSEFVVNQEQPEDERVEAVRVSEEVEQSDLLVISLHAKPGQSFGDYMFLQTLGSVGLVFGDHNIFHYDVKTDIGDARLFSVAKLNNPGTFDIDDIESVACKGLLFFIHLRICKKPLLALDCLLDVAQQLADDLDGVLYEGYHIPWKPETAQRFRLKLENRSL